MNRFDLAPALSHDELDAANGGFLPFLGAALSGLTGARSAYGDYDYFGGGYGGGYGGYGPVGYFDDYDFVGPAYGGGLYGPSYINAPYINPVVANGYVGYGGSYPGYVPTNPATLGAIASVRI